jgi:hypothetical protein
MSKANVYNWIKKNDVNVENSLSCLELDELYWFIGKKAKTETRENVYVIIMVSREPRQIVGFDVARDKSQGMKQLMAGGGVALLGMTLVPLLANLFS